MPAIVLVHSPLTGPDIWLPVRRSLERRGYRVVVPEIGSDSDAAVYWRRDAGDAARVLAKVPLDEPLLLVAHSGAGLLLPAIREMTPHPVAGYVLVDAGIPVDGLSRLELIRQESAELAAALERHLESGGRFPEWSQDDLREIVPDTDRRAALIDDLRPQPLGFFTEPIPVFNGWPDAPCAYIQLSPGYATYAAHARSRGWAVREIAAGHFHMLVHPDEVAEAIIRSMPPG